MKKDVMNVCVLMTCYNRKEKTTKCVESLVMLNPLIQFKFIVVDDGCTDGTCEELLSLQDMDVTVLVEKGNLYYSGGMRVAIENAKKIGEEYDFFLLVNDDVDFYQNTIANLINLQYADAIVVGVTDDGHGNMTYGGVISCSQFRPSFKKVKSNGEVVHCDTFNANCVLIPNHIFMKLDNIDIYYEHGFGDYDYGLMAKKKGIDIVASPFFVGKCERNKIENTWMDESLPIHKRISLKEKPTGSPSKMWFYFTCKHFGFVAAILTIAYQYLIILFKRIDK